MVGSFIPQGESGTREVSAWALARPTLEPLVRALDLHHAFTAPVFLVAVSLLTLSTVVCSWRRTKVSISRTHALARARAADTEWLRATHDFEVLCPAGLGPAEALAVASEALSGIGARTRHSGNLLTTVSPGLSVWGSPIFHWSLVAFMAVVLVGSLQRSDGLMAVAVGQTRPDTPASYGLLRSGPLHNWAGVRRSFRVDAFEPDYQAGGLDLGPVPTVSVLDAQGGVIKTQRVYPNMMLHVGSVSINAPDYGLSATVSLVGTGGVELGGAVQSVDFSQEATDGTIPLDPLVVYDSSGSAKLIVSVTVPLDRSGERFVEWIPRAPTARVTVRSPDGARIVDRVLKPGERLVLSNGDTLRLDGVGWYSRLSIVDDWTTPLVYGCMTLAMIGIGISVVFRQQWLVVGVLEDAGGLRLAASMRLWRNCPATRAEIESALSVALGGANIAGAPEAVAPVEPLAKNEEGYGL